LRHLYRRGHIAADLSDTVIGPRIYEHEGIPSALRAEEVQKVIEVTGADLSPAGLRDHAILLLLARYGLRAAEIVRLRLEDIDWRRDVLRVRHTKTGTCLELPLLAEPGEALLRYLEKGAHQAHIERFSSVSSRRIVRLETARSSTALRGHVSEPPGFIRGPRRDPTHSGTRVP